ncbi:MAG: FecR domain-containing protein [Deltaproteobacteria bacterium]|nr:FecR domain-containing protein [Deltaproteobacteria bacterium]
MRKPTKRVVAVGAAVVVVVLARQLQAQGEAGVFAAVQGKVEVQRRGAWQDATIGTPFQVGDRMRTGAGDRAKLVLRDDSVLDMAPGSEIVVDDMVTDPAQQKVQSALRLFQGRVRAWVSEAYHQPRAHYEIETPTAVAGVRGTEFIAAYDIDTEATEIIGLVEDVDVVGKIAAMSGGRVRIGPNMTTRILKGRLPTVPARVDEGHLRQYLDSFDLIGTGRRDGLNVFHPVLAGRLIEPGDVPGGAEEAPQEALLGGKSPDLPLADRLSLDSSTNSQPLQGFRASPPGQGSTGGVRVNF